MISILFNYGVYGQHNL